MKIRVAEGALVADPAHYERLYAESAADPSAFWGGRPRGSPGITPGIGVRRRLRRGGLRLVLAAGRLNACYNCVDRHLPTHGDQTAIIWVQDEPGQYEHIYLPGAEAQRLPRGQRAAQPRSAQGRPGLRLHADDPRARLHHARLRPHRRRALGGLRRVQRRGPPGPHRGRAGAALSSPPTRGCAAASRSPSRRPWTGPSRAWTWSRRCSWRGAPTRETEMRSGRDHLARRGVPQAALHLHRGVDGRRGPAVRPLYLGSTGKPKGVLHTTGGYLVYAAVTHGCVFDYHPATSTSAPRTSAGSPATPTSSTARSPTAPRRCMFESTPTYPDPGRYWQDRGRPRGEHLLHRADGAPRHRAGRRRARVKRYQRRACASWARVGEPINPEIWRWYHDVVGRGALRGGGHLVADRDRRDPDHAAARGDPHQARLGHAAVLRHQAGGRGPGRRARAGRATA